MDMWFDDSLKYYLPVYYHFLDGFLDPIYGYTLEKTLSFLYNNNILIPQDINEIYFKKYEFKNDLIILNHFYSCKKRDPEIIEISKNDLDVLSKIDRLYIL